MQRDGARVAISPPAALAERPRLFGALSAVLGVSFEGRDRDKTSGVDAVLSFTGPGSRAEDRPGPPLLVLREGATGAPSRAEVVLARSTRLDRRLRGARIHESAAVLGPAAPGRAEVLASSDGVPLWTARQPGAGEPETALAPPELDAGEPLFGALRPGRFIALLPLVHFLRRTVAGAGWTAPPLRSTFLFDDPNLHWPSYGFVDYDDLARRARAGGYHASMAMVPADGRVVHPRAARTFRENPSALSLVMHGNDHLRQELARPRSAAAADALFAQALRRVAAFERRSGIGVGRLMVPPHGACSRESLERMLPFDVEAVCLSRTHPWLDDPPPDEPWSGWAAADFVAGGMPVIPRIPIDQVDEEVPLRAFLDHPLVLYGHHDDLSGGPELLDRIAERVDGLGDVRWCSPARIARSNYVSRVDGPLLEVRPLSRRVTVEVPEGAEAVRLVVPREGVDSERAVVRCGTESRRLEPAGRLLATEPFPIDAGGLVEIAFSDRRPTDPSGVPAPPRRLWPLARRTLTQCRDRAQPVVRRTAARARVSGR
jgi:hypothetical protein